MELICLCHFVFQAVEYILEKHYAVRLKFDVDSKINAFVHYLITMQLILYMYSLVMRHDMVNDLSTIVPGFIPLI